MPYAKNGDINIYYEIDGEGPPLVILHGLTASLEGWRESGYVDAMKDDYQIILMDFRGHGKSDKPHDPAMCVVENIVGDVIAVLNSLGIETANFFGYSFGGGICFELARYVPERIKSLIVGGAGARLPPPEMFEEVIKSLKAGIEAVTSKYRQGGEISPQEAHLLSNDPEALAALCKGVGSSPSLIDDLPRMKMPFLIFTGESDFAFSGAKETSELLPDATFISFPGLDHSLAGGSPDLVVPYIRKFLARVNKT
jgi:pimeloyl-ACP methyl ester carboxylesterase